MFVQRHNQKQNEYRFVCKILNSDKQGVYYFNKNKTVKELLNTLTFKIKNDFKIEDEFKILYRKSYSKNGLVLLENSNEILEKKFNNININLEIKVSYMYSFNETIFYNKKNKKNRISYIIKIDAIKVIQKFYRSFFKKECPCCLSELILTTKYYNCQHLICNNCFTQWSKSKNTCPCCRSEVKQCWKINQPISYIDVNEISQASERRAFDWFNLITFANRYVNANTPSSVETSVPNPSYTSEAEVPLSLGELIDANIDNNFNYYNNRTVPDQIITNNTSNIIQYSNEMLELIEDLNTN